MPESSSAALPPLTTRETAHLASAFCFLWFLANWSLTAGLGLTHVASATILSSMSGVWEYDCKFHSLCSDVQAQVSSR